MLAVGLPLQSATSAGARSGGLLTAQGAPRGGGGGGRRKRLCSGHSYHSTRRERPLIPFHPARTAIQAMQRPDARRAGGQARRYRVPPGGRVECTRRTAPGQQQPANNPFLQPLPVPLGCAGGPSGGGRAPRSAGHHPSAAAAGLSGSRLLSSQAGSGTCPAGAASSSGDAAQGRPKAEIGADAARERRKQAGKDIRKGRSLAEVVAAILRIAARMGVQTEGVQLSRPPEVRLPGPYPATFCISFCYSSPVLPDTLLPLAYLGSLGGVY